MTRLCRVRNGNITWGPGLPKNVRDDESSDILALHQMLPQERETKGFFEIEERGKRVFDDRYEYQTISGLVVEDGKPVELYSYSFIPNWANKFLELVDKAAETARSNLATSLPLQTMEYEYAIKEAEEVKDALENEQVLSDSDYPFLSADIGATDNPETGAKVANIEEAAAIVLEQTEHFKTFGSQIRNARLKAKSDIRQSKLDGDPLSAKAIYEAFLSEVNVDG